MGRIWHKIIPPKKVQELFHLYEGTWLPLMDQCWESEDGYNVMSRQIRTSFGVVEHITIQNAEGKGDVPWSVKQEIKDELFGFNRIAIEVFPAKKNLVDVCDVYHMWLLPKDFKMPFGIHPVRDPFPEPVERGYDYDINECVSWSESEERRLLMSDRELTQEQKDRLLKLSEIINGRQKEIHTLR